MKQLRDVVPARGVQQNVDPAELSNGFLHHRRGHIRMRHITQGGCYMGRWETRLQLALRALRPLRIPTVDDHRLGARREQRLGASATDAGRSSGDHDRGAVQHAVTPARRCCDPARTYQSTPSGFRSTTTSLRRSRWFTCARLSPVASPSRIGSEVIMRAKRTPNVSTTRFGSLR